MIYRGGAGWGCAGCVGGVGSVGSVEGVRGARSVWGVWGVGVMIFVGASLFLMLGCGIDDKLDLWEREFIQDKSLHDAAITALGDREGAIIIIDPRSGRVRAIVGGGSVENGGDGGDGVSGVGGVDDGDRVVLSGEDIAVRMSFPPGSLVKLVTAWAGLESGAIDPDTVYECTGKVEFDGEGGAFSCWDPRGHGELNLVSAIAYSCNIYFYNLAGVTGAMPTYDALKRLGFGEKTGINLSGEVEGTIIPPDPDHFRDYVIGDTDNITATPLQIIVSLSALVNGGYLFVPRVVETPEEICDFIPEIKRKVEVNRSLAILKTGMLESVRYGTGKPSGIEGIDIFSKTGTGGFVGPVKKTHGWFVGFAPARMPEIAVLVFVYRGRGSEDAAPIAREVFEAYFEMTGEGQSGD